MRSISLITVGLSMVFFGLWLILASPPAHANNDTGYLGMGEWRSTISEPDDAC